MAATGNRCFAPDRIDRALPIALAIGQVIASAIGQGTAVAIAPGIVAAIGRARRIVPKVVATAPKLAAEIVPRPEARVAEIARRPPIAAAAPRAVAVVAVPP